MSLNISMKYIYTIYQNNTSIKLLIKWFCKINPYTTFIQYIDIIYPSNIYISIKCISIQYIRSIFIHIRYIHKIHQYDLPLKYFHTQFQARDHFENLSILSSSREPPTHLRVDNFQERARNLCTICE